MHNRPDRITVEDLAIDCLDASQLYRAGLFDRLSSPRWPSLKWPKIERMRTDR